MQRILGKYLYLRSDLYEIIEGKLNQDTISLKNVLTSRYVRHSNGLLQDSDFIDSQDELFLHDSSFYFEISENKISLFCSNDNLRNCCVADMGYVMRIVELHNDILLNNQFNLLSKDEIFVKENNILECDSNIKVISFGSSTTEVFDYVFGDNPNYIPCWASGWSARGLRYISKQIHPYINILTNVSKDSIIFLHFGTTDIDFNLAFKARNSGFYDVEGFKSEMTEGIISFRNYLLNELGFKNVYAVFAGPIVDVPCEYYVNAYGFYPLPTKMRAKILWDFAYSLSLKIPVINYLPEMVESASNPICKAEYIRDYPDNHINFIKVSDKIYKRLSHISNMLPARKEKLSSLYEHIAYFVQDAVMLNKPRPRTCR